MCLVFASGHLKPGHLRDGKHFFSGVVSGLRKGWRVGEDLRRLQVQEVGEAP